MKHKRKSPTLTEAQRKSASKRLSCLRADPFVEHKRLFVLGKTIAKKYANPEYRQFMREQGEIGRQTPGCSLKNRERFRKYWKDKTFRAAASKRMAAQRRDPEFIARMEAGKRSPQGRANRAIAARKAWVKRRGFRVPPPLKAEYRKLIHGKGYRAVEAGRLLGLI